MDQSAQRSNRKVIPRPKSSLMKTERLNGVIAALCSITFVLQAVGYLAPAWFVREYRVRHGTDGFLMDGKRFMLIGRDPPNVDDVLDDAMISHPSRDDVDVDRRRRSISIDDPPSQDSGTSDGKPLPSFMNFNILPQTQQTEHGDDNSEITGDVGPNAMPDTTNFNTNDGSIPDFSIDSLPKNTDGDDVMNKDDEIPRIVPVLDPPKDDDDQKQSQDKPDSIPMLPSKDEADETDDLNPTMGDNGHSPTHFMDYADTTDNGWSVNQGARFPQDVANLGGMPGGNDMNELEKSMMVGNYVAHKRMLHVTAGLWYARACVNSIDPHSFSGDEVGTEWCTMYLRTNESTLEDKMGLVEFRIEASIGLAISMVGLLVASSACGSQPRQGTRMVISLVCMFVSGAVILVPVVHVIVQHHELGGVFHRNRQWSRFMVHTYASHDLFDHWSAILCGIGSILSVGGSIIITIVGCGRNTSPGNRYDLGKSEKGKKGKQKPSGKVYNLGKSRKGENGKSEKGENGRETTSGNIYDLGKGEKGGKKRELPVNWARNNKITTPPGGKEERSETPDSLEGDSDYHTETKEECPSIDVPQDDAIVLDINEDETGNGNAAIDDEKTGNGDLADHEVIDIFEDVLEDD